MEEIKEEILKPLLKKGQKGKRGEKEKQTKMLKKINVITIKEKNWGRVKWGEGGGSSKTHCVKCNYKQTKKRCLFWLNKNVV